MDIRFINKKNEIINASKLSIKVIGDCLIGFNEENDAITIENFETEEEARLALKDIGYKIEELSNYGQDAVIDLRK